MAQKRHSGVADLRRDMKVHLTVLEVDLVEQPSHAGETPGHALIPSPELLDLKLVKQS